MADQLLLWDIYDIRSDATPLTNVSLRGRVRKYGAQNSINVLIENASDVGNCVRFAVLSDEDYTRISEYVLRIAPDVTITQNVSGVPNPVLSKLSIVTNEAKYSV